jgi:serine/threonine-protein kinase
MPSSNPSADRNLLFGILALQMDFISRDALIAGMQAWVFNKSTPLGQILLEQRALQADTHALLEALVQKHLEMHGDAEKSLASVSSISSLRDQLSQIADPELCASFAHVSAARKEEAVPGPRAPAGNENEEAEAPATRPPSVGTPTSSGLRFRILRPHARGGLGEVFVACDEELHREVALKEIQGRHADHRDSRTRFVLEAEITGGLEHPGIVPVYGLGHYADGRPFYAMRFIRGDSLQQAVEAFHKADVPGRDVGERTLSLRQLLGRFVDVCQAIAYAHSRGVLHRDLKPGNIMLGQYGETVVVDWGMAKAGSGADLAANSAEGPLRPVMASNTEPTRMGSVVGTPEFMPPEQAAGRLDHLGPASDVYSLGATLYCLLTGKAPFEAKEDGALLQRVQKGDFPAPRQVKRNTPAALVAICLKAMALRPEDRYASARALADDIEQWLADEPVSAWSEPLAVRLRRWLGRHRTLVTGVAAAVLVATVTLSAATLLLMAANQRERQARQDAEANLDLAKEIVDDCFNVCKDNPLFQQPRMEKVKKLLLRRTLPFYKRMLEQRPADRGLLWNEADQWYRIGYIEYVLGEARQARTAYEKARELFGKLVKAHPGLHQYQTALAGTHNNLGLLLGELGERKEALKEYQQARDLQQQLVNDHPNLHLYQYALATAHTNLGNLLADLGKHEKALQEYQQARDLLLKLVRAHRDLHEYQNHLAGTHNNLGLLLKELGKPKEAMKEYQQARDLLRKLVEAHPDLPEYLNDLARTHNNLGFLLREVAKRKEALKEFQQARDLLLELVGAHPHMRQYQGALARTHNNLGILLTELGDSKEAMKEYQQARDLLLKLVKAHRDLPGYRITLAGTWCNMANLLRNSGKATDSLQHYAEAVTLLQAIHERDPQHATARLFLRNSRGGRALALASLGRHGEAAADWEHALRLDPRTFLSFIHLELADSRPRTGDYARAAAEAEELGRIPSLPGTALYDLACIQAVNARAASKDDKRPLAEREKRARQYASAALALLERARRSDYFKDPKMIDHMKKDSDLELLRQSEDYRLWLKRLEDGSTQP